MKNLRTFSATAILCFLTIGLFAQSTTTDRNYKKGKKLYDQFSYNEAIKPLEAAYKSGVKDALPLLAYSYYYALNYEKAILYFKELALNKNARPEYWIIYGKLLKNFGQYNMAKQWFVQAIRNNPSNEAVRELIKSCDLASVLEQNPFGFGLTPWHHNTEFLDFCPDYWFDQVVFTSNRKSYINNSSYGWDDMPYLNLYVQQSSDSSKLSLFAKNLMAKYHNGPAVFTKNGIEMFLTRNNVIKGKVGKDGKGVTRLKIIKYNFAKDSWRDEMSLPFNSDNYSVGHPTVSDDGNTLYFASDMPGSIGGVDIWYCTRDAENSWSAPVNLGRPLNTPGDETFPRLFNDTVLYFSSNYHPGLGGSDIFRANRINGRFVDIINMGAPINSVRDDFGILLDEDGKSGYISSNRLGGKGGDDIYSFRKIDVCLTVSVIDSTNFNLLSDATVRIFSETGFSEEWITGIDGKVKTCVPTSKMLTIAVEREGYRSKRKLFNTDSIIKDMDSILVVELVPGTQQYHMTGIVVDYDLDYTIEDAIVKITQNGEPLDILKSDPNGKIRLDLDPKTEYELVASKDGYLVHKEKFVTPSNDFEKRIRIRKLDDKNAKLNVAPIYYDLDKADIRSDAAQILDEIAAIMIANPYIQVELGSHTDIRASDDYNKELSRRRAVSALDYLVAKGVERYRLSYKYYGKENPLVRCPKPDGSECSESDHQLNRRTDFRIISK